MDTSEYAKDLFNKGYLCSQSVFATFCEEYGISKDLGLKISRFLGFGFNYRGDYCGAISGALMIYSLKYSSGEVYDELSNEVCFQACQGHIKRFTQKHGSCICKELLNADLSTEDGMTYLRENHVFDTKCPVFVEDSAGILTQIVSEMDEKLSRMSNV